MTDNKQLNFVKIEAKGFQDLCKKLAELEKQNDELQEELTHFKAKNYSLSKRCRKLATENQDLALEVKDLKFTHNYLTSEEAGKAFARELLGKPMTEADLAEERAISQGEAHYERTWNVACGDDF